MVRSVLRPQLWNSALGHRRIEHSTDKSILHIHFGYIYFSAHKSSKNWIHSHLVVNMERTATEDELSFFLGNTPCGVAFKLKVI